MKKRKLLPLHLLPLHPESMGENLHPWCFTNLSNKFYLKFLVWFLEYFNQGLKYFCWDIWLIIPLFQSDNPAFIRSILVQNIKVRYTVYLGYDFHILENIKLVFRLYFLKSSCHIRLLVQSLEVQNYKESRGIWLKGIDVKLLKFLYM